MQTRGRRSPADVVGRANFFALTETGNLFSLSTSLGELPLRYYERPALAEMGQSDDSGRREICRSAASAVVCSRSLRLPPWAVEGLAGFTAGTVATLGTHPFDILKTRLALDRAVRPGRGNALRLLAHVVRTEGGPRALYRGLSPNLLGNSVAWGLYFMWYHSLKDLMARRRLRQGSRGTGRLENFDYFAASGLAGVLTVACTNPVWVIKTRMLASGRHVPGAYRGVGHGVAMIWKSEGIRGFYHGLLPSFIGVGHAAIQFVAYERLKSFRTAQLARSGQPRWATATVPKSEPLSGSATPAPDLSSLDYLVLSSLAKMTAVAITYPYQVVRSRLQAIPQSSLSSALPRPGRGVAALLGDMWRHEGVLGFYKG